MSPAAASSEAGTVHLGQRADGGKQKDLVNKKGGWDTARQYSETARSVTLNLLQDPWRGLINAKDLGTIPVAPLPWQ